MKSRRLNTGSIELGYRWEAMPEIQAPGEPIISMQVV
jgi:hypothetical protein